MAIFNTIYVGSTPTDTEYVWWSPEMTSSNTPAPYVVEASSVVNNTAPDPWRAFSGDETNSHAGQLWAVWFSKNEPSWILFDFGRLRSIKGLNMLPCPSNAESYTVEYRSYFPKTFVIQGSNDKSSWNDLFTSKETDNYDPQTGGYRECLFDEPAYYRYFRISCNKNYSTGSNTKFAVIKNILFYRPTNDLII